MQVWIFRSRSGMLALTVDATGASLPPVDGSWRQLKEVTLAGADRDELEAIDLIREFGFCCFDESTPPE
ncbi:MAG: hypothetical protein JWR80_2738 [Bradyrhizobium sp.]|jgi:hypothetical protein|nr:hypothetical protein [Bradyrhizobium sp.]